ncbi:MAG: methyltransferase [Terracidiphilus sp.]
MRASRIEFRFRMAINAAIIVLGFWAPWSELLGPSQRITLLERLALELSRAGLLSFAIATAAISALAAALAAVGVLLRVWGTAYLGPTTVNTAAMKAGTVMADGPYRYVRNPLYLGIWFMAAGLAFLMPATGAPVTMLLLTFFLLRLILGEEEFLTAQLGEPYRAYLMAVPRIAPRLRTSLARAGASPRWLHATLAELIPIGVFVALVCYPWTYDHRLMPRIVLISFGLSLIARAFMRSESATSTMAG